MRGVLAIVCRGAGGSLPPPGEPGRGGGWSAISRHVLVIGHMQAGMQASRMRWVL